MKYINFGLTVVALFYFLLAIINDIIARNNAELSSQLMNAQQEMSVAHNNEVGLQNLTMRVAEGSLKDPALRDLLVKNQLRAKVDVNGQEKEVP